MKKVVDAINLRAMRSASAVTHYSRRDDLSPPEQACLDAVAAEARGRPILDIGVGGGRTVKALMSVSSDYLGVDYSEEMVAACRRRFPRARFQHADARDLSGIRSGSIFLAVFSCNGIGMVSHADRSLILRSVHRALQPGGVFIFSTHNQSSSDHSAGFQFPELEMSRNPARALWRAARFAKHTAIRVYNRRRYAKHDLRTAEYSIINDVCHDYGTMLYYITLANQRRQIEELGFAENAAAYDLDGRFITKDTTHNSISMIARK